MQLEESLTRKSESREPNSYQKLPVMDIIDIKFCAEDIALNNPSNWKSLIGEIIQRLTNLDPKDPDSTDLTLCLNLARRMLENPESRVTKACNIQRLLEEVITKRTQRLVALE